MDVDWIEHGVFSCLIPSGLPPVSILNLYVFYEKRDALKVLCEGTAVNVQHAALVTVGFLPLPENIRAIRSMFQNARFRTAFGNDMPAMALACKISLWIKGLDATFLTFNSKVIFTFKSCEFSCAESRFSLNRFCKLTGFSTNVRPLRMR